MPDPVEVRPVRHIEFRGDADKKAVGLFLTDATGATNGYVVDPATLRALLEPLISLAATWSGDPDFSVEGLGGTRNALTAKQIVLAPGRDQHECAVRVLLGKDIDLTFLLPLNAVMGAFRNFSQIVRPAGSQQPN